MDRGGTSGLPSRIKGPFEVSVHELKVRLANVFCVFLQPSSGGGGWAQVRVFRKLIFTQVVVLYIDVIKGQENMNARE